MLFIRGNAISGEDIIIGISQLPNPPIISGITVKKIIMNAWAVTTILKVWSSPISLLGDLSSERIIRLKDAPIMEDHIPSKKYIVPMSLWLVENNHRFILRWLI